MKRLALPRVGEVIEERRERIERDLAKAEALKGETEQALATYERALGEARARASTLAKDVHARLTAEVDAERIACAREAARRWGAHVVLKGSPTVVAEPGGRAALNLTGNPGLAVGGSGDVLTGVLGSLLAQGVDPALACRAAPCLHGLAADWAKRDLGERGMTPGDLLRYLPLAIREIEAGRGRELLAAIDHPRAALLGARVAPAEAFA